MASPAPREPLALAESVRAVLGGLDDDPKLQGKGLSAAFARSFPDLPAEVKSLAATEAARVAVVLGVPGIAVMDVVQARPRGSAGFVKCFPAGKPLPSPPSQCFVTCF